MNWDLKDSGTQRPRALPEHIDRRLRFALARFGDRVERVVVFLKDLNGPKGGVDKVCRILVKVRGCGVAVAAVIDSDWVAAVDRATTRIGHNVSRDLDRLRRRQGDSVRLLRHRGRAGRVGS